MHAPAQEVGAVRVEGQRGRVRAGAIRGAEHDGARRHHRRQRGREEDEEDGKDLGAREAGLDAPGRLRVRALVSRRCSNKVSPLRV